MNIKQYCEELHKTKKSFAFYAKVKKDNKEKEIIEHTAFINDKRISTRVYCILQDITEQPLCECGKPLKFNQYSEGFREFCSVKCSSNSKSKQDKIKQTNIKKYGHKNAFHSDNGRQSWNNYAKDDEKIKQMVNKGQETLKNNYDVDTIDEAQKIRVEKSLSAKEKKYGSKTYNNREKAKLSRDEVKIQEKLQETCMKKYGVKNHMHTIAGFEKCMKSTFRKKTYTFPSGKSIKVQGFENFALDELLEIYDELEIVTETKSMPEIWYIGEDNKKHRYYPDIFIPKDNLIIEVKSDYTMKANFYTNLLKGDACKKAGYNFKYKVYGNKGKTLI